LLGDWSLPAGVSDPRSLNRPRDEVVSTVVGDELFSELTDLVRVIGDELVGDRYEICDVVVACIVRTEAGGVWERWLKPPVAITQQIM